MIISEWQPIETAPKDGSLALLYEETLGVVVGVWDHEWFFWEGGFVWANDKDLGDLNSWIKGYGPTHWMPLPEPPSQEPLCPHSNT